MCRETEKKHTTHLIVKHVITKKSEKFINFYSEESNVDVNEHDHHDQLSKLYKS